MKRIVLPLLFAVMVLVPMGLTGCGDSSCPPDQVVASLERIQEVAEKISGPAEKLQSVETTDDLAPIKEEFQALRDETALIEIPECLTATKFELVATYDSYIKAIDALESNDVDGANAAMAEADEHLAKFSEELDKVAAR